MKKDSGYGITNGVFRYCNPIKSDEIGNIRDPLIIKVADKYYLTGTTTPFWKGANPGVKLWSSRDLINWKFESLLIDRSRLAPEVWYRDRFWAPEIHRADGKFWLTFNSRNESEKHEHVHSCGLAVADNVTGPFKVLTHEKPLIDGWGNDMTLFTDDDGISYAYWKDHWVQKIDLPAARLYGEKLRTLTHEKGTWEDIGIEGMFVVKRGGKYFMFYSSWTRGYEVGYATAETPMGPWHKYKGNPVYGAQDEEICRERGFAFTGDPDSPFIAAGHNAIFTGPDGGDWICAHLQMKGDHHKGNNIHLGYDPVRIEDGFVKISGPAYKLQEINIPRDK